MCLHPDVIDALAAAGATGPMIAAACRAAWVAEGNPPLAKPSAIPAARAAEAPDETTHLYLVEVLSKDTFHPIKIGISSNIQRRLHGLREMGIYFPRLLGYFTFENRLEARLVEEMAHAALPPCLRREGISKEIHEVSLDEALAFLLPLVGGRPFNRVEAQS